MKRSFACVIWYLEAHIVRRRLNVFIHRSAYRFSAIAIVAVALLMSACGTPGKNLPVTEGKAIADADGVQQITIKVESYYFEPSRAHVTVGKPVRLILKSGTFLIPHNLSIHAPEAGIDFDRDIGHGDSTLVEFTPTKIGEFRMFCDKSGHAKKGMVGTLVVEP
jgi:plastocyanin